MKRPLFPISLLVVCFGCLGRMAQAGPGSPLADVPTFSFSLCQLGGEAPPPLYLLKTRMNSAGDPVTEYVPLEVPNGMRSKPVEIPLVPPPRIFTKLSSGGKAEMKPFLEIPAKKPKEKLLLVMYLDPQGRQQYTFFDDSSSAHSPGTVRVINLSGNRIAFNTGASQPVTVSPGSQAISNPKIDSEKRFPFEYFSEIPGKSPYHSPVQMLRMREQGGRLLVIFSTSVQDERGERNDLPVTPQNTTLVSVPTRLPDSVAVLEQPDTKQTTAETDKRVPGALPISPVKQVQNREIVVVSLAALPNDGRIELTNGETHVPAILSPRTLKTIPVPSGTDSEVSLNSGGECLTKVPNSGSSLQHLIMLLSNSQGEKGLKAVVVENSLQSHPKGQPRLFNLTPFEVAYAVGKDIARVNPFQDSLVQNPQPGSDAVWKVAVKTPEGWKLIDEKQFQFAAPEMRPCLFVYQDPSDSQFKLLEQMQ